MAVYVDDEMIPWQGRLWCHLVADTLPELHAFARRLGLRQTWFQSTSVYPHYDVTVNIRDRALTLGASIGDRQTIITCARLLKREMRPEEQAVSQSCT